MAQTQPERVVVVGDVFTKGPDAAGVWSLLQDVGAVGVLGNHDAAMLRRPKRYASMNLPQSAWDWLARLPVARQEGDWTVVHAGLNPELGLPGTARATAIAVRRWPDDTGHQHPFWWENWHRPERVIYGHDAVRGLQDHRPHTLGLDTGCVYGGALTGYLVEEDRLVSVPAQAVYRGVSSAAPSG